MIKLSYEKECVMKFFLQKKRMLQNSKTEIVMSSFLKTGHLKYHLF